MGSSGRSEKHETTIRCYFGPPDRQIVAKPSVFSFLSLTDRCTILERTQRPAVVVQRRLERKSIAKIFITESSNRAHTSQHFSERLAKQNGAVGLKLAPSRVWQQK